MPSKKRILARIEEEARFIEECYRRAHTMAKLLLDDAREKYADRERDLISEHDHQASVAREKHDAKLQNILDEYQSKKNYIKSNYEQSQRTRHETFDAISKSLGWSELGFDDSRWNGYASPTTKAIPKLGRIGQLTAVGEHGQIVFPALVPILGSGHVFIEASGEAKDVAAEAMQCLMLRLLAALPAGKLRYIFIDPVGLGSNMAGFMNLPEYLYGSKAWTEANHIEQRLIDLSEQMENVIQKYLKNQYEDMEEYNEQAEAVAEPYRILAVANFPVNFNESSARRLINIASNGPRTGVHIIATIDKNQPNPYAFDLGELERTGVVIEFKGNRFQWRDQILDTCSLNLDRLPPPILFDDIVRAVSKSAEDAKRVEIPFNKIVPHYDAWWNKEGGDSRSGLVAAMGMRGANKILNIDLGKGTAIHALVAGKTGSGKSNLLHVIIMSLALKYSPDELELYLVDFKKGVEFRDYAFYQLPHAKVIAIQSEREFGISVLQGLDRELQRRGDVFREKGVQDIRQFRDKFRDERMPRTLVIVDEYQEFFTQQDTLATQSSFILDRLVRQGRAMGMHVLLASQGMASTYDMSHNMTDQMSVRIALQCSEADSRLILGADNPAARLLERPGEAIYNAANGAIEGNKNCQIFMLADDEREALLAELTKKMRESHVGALPQPPIVFEGNAPAEFERNREIISLLGDYIWSVNDKILEAYLGEPIAIKPPTAATFKRQSRSNAVIIGQNEETAMGMITTTILSLSAQQAPDNVGFMIANLSTVDSLWHDVPTVLAEALPHEVKIAKRREAMNMIAQCAEIVNMRIKRSNEYIPRIFLFLIGLNRMRDIRVLDDYTLSKGASDLSIIVREGPDVGVHTLIWSDTISNLYRAVDRSLLAEFDMRIALEMSANDSIELIYSELANKLESYRAILFDEEKAGSIEKFRPYSIPCGDFIKRVGSELCMRWRIKHGKVQ